MRFLELMTEPPPIVFKVFREFSSERLIRDCQRTMSILPLRVSGGVIDRCHGALARSQNKMTNQFICCHTVGKEKMLLLECMISIEQQTSMLANDNGRWVLIIRAISKIDLILAVPKVHRFRSGK